MILSSSASQRLPSSNSRVWYYSDLIKTPEDRDLDFPPASVVQTDTAALLYSSGTTETSKGVILTHRNFIAAGVMVTADQAYYGESSNVFLCFLPMFHIFGLSVILYAQLVRGNTVVTVAKFEIEKVVRSVEKYRVTHMFVVPPVMIALAKQSVVRKYDLWSLRQICSGAAPLGKDVMDDCAKNVPQAAVIQVFKPRIGIYLQLLLINCCKFCSLAYVLLLGIVGN